MKSTKYQTFGTVQKDNRKIVKTEDIAIPLTDSHGRSLSWFRHLESGG